MKIWNAYGSEHSANIVLVGTFKEVAEAVETMELLEKIEEQVREDRDNNRLDAAMKKNKFTEGMLELLFKESASTLGPLEVEQVAYDVQLKQEGNTIRITTDELDISAFIKVLIHNGAKIELFSAHDYPEDK